MTSRPPVDAAAAAMPPAGTSAGVTVDGHTVAATLVAVGFRPSTDTDAGHFTLTRHTQASPPESVLLTATGQSWFSELVAMAGILANNDYTTEETDFADMLAVRAATPAELAERHAHAEEARRRLWALLDL